MSGEYFLNPKTCMYQPDRRRAATGGGDAPPTSTVAKRSGGELRITSDQFGLIAASLDRAKDLNARLRTQTSVLRAVIYLLSLIALVVYVGILDGAAKEPAETITIETKLLAFAGRVTVAQVSAVAPLVFAFLLLSWARLTVSRATVEAEIMLTDFVLRRFGVPTTELLASEFRSYFKSVRNQASPADESIKDAATRQLKDFLARQAHHIVHYTNDALVYLVGIVGAAGVSWSAADLYSNVWQSNRYLGGALYVVLALSAGLPLLAGVAANAAKKKKQELVQQFFDDVRRNPEVLQRWCCGNVGFPRDNGRI